MSRGRLCCTEEAHERREIKPWPEGICFQDAEMIERPWAMRLDAALVDLPRINTNYEGLPVE